MAVGNGGRPFSTGSFVTSSQCTLPTPQTLINEPLIFFARGGGRPRDVLPDSVELADELSPFLSCIYRQSNETKRTDQLEGNLLSESTEVAGLGGPSEAFCEWVSGL